MGDHLPAKSPTMIKSKNSVNLSERLTAAIIIFLFVVVGAFCKDLSVGDATEHAIQQSSLTLPGSKPFHLKFDISETSDPDTDDYKASVEEYWISPSKWRRVITSKDFSQTLIVNGDAVSETDEGDYFPHWLSGFVTAVLDLMPAEMLNALKHVNVPVRRPFEGARNCGDMAERVDRWVICFEDNHGLFESIFTKGYAAEYKDYKKFGDKWVARDVVDNPEAGTTVEARIRELTELAQADEQMFAINQPTPRERRITSVKVDEDTFNKLLLGSMDIDWPTVGEGLLKGGCGLYISADRSGRVREATPQGCDNAAMEEPLHNAAMKWQLKPATVDGARVQVEALLGIPFQTTLNSAKSLPTLSDAEARKLANNTVDPVFPPDAAPHGTEFTVQITVDETGTLTGIGGAKNGNGPIGSAIANAIKQWKFKPYLKDGEPQSFHASLLFRMP